MKRYISLINTSVPFGKGLNALAHTSIGIGHWIPNDKIPNIMILFADEETIREFRKEALKVSLAHPNQMICSDFINTMTVGTTDNCVKTTKETSDNELTYYAVSVCAEEKILESKSFTHIIRKCKTLKNYQPYITSDNESEFSFKKIVELPDYQSLSTKKLSLTLDRTRSPAELMNSIVIASLSIGIQTDLHQLKLVTYTDADNQEHPYISYHPFPILAARQQNKFNELTKIIENDPSLVKRIVRDKNGNTISICMLGTEDQVNTHTRQKFISLWTAELPEDSFVNG